MAARPRGNFDNRRSRVHRRVRAGADFDPVFSAIDGLARASLHLKRVRGRTRDVAAPKRRHPGRHRANRISRREGNVMPMDGDGPGRRSSRQSQRCSGGRSPMTRPDRLLRAALGALDRRLRHRCWSLAVAASRPRSSRIYSTAAPPKRLPRPCAVGVGDPGLRRRSPALARPDPGGRRNRSRKRSRLRADEAGPRACRLGRDSAAPIPPGGPSEKPKPRLRRRRTRSRGRGRRSRRARRRIEEVEGLHLHVLQARADRRRADALPPDGDEGAGPAAGERLFQVPEAERGPRGDLGRTARTAARSWSTTWGSASCSPGRSRSTLAATWRWTPIATRSPRRGSAT